MKQKSNLFALGFIKDQLRTYSYIDRQQRLYIFLFIFFAFFLTLSSAQSDSTPTLVFKPQYSFVDGETLYIRGGWPIDGSQAPVKQFYVLDLTPLLKDSTDMSWKKLNSTMPSLGPLNDFGQDFPIAAALDQQPVVYILGSNDTISRWNSVLDRWSKNYNFCQLDPSTGAPLIPPSIPSQYGSDFALTAPNIGFVFVPYGARNSTQLLAYTENPTWWCYAYAMPVDGQGMYYAWSSSTSSIYMVGLSWFNKPLMWQFFYKTKRWETLSVTPPKVLEIVPSGGCMVFANNMLLLFGGLDESNTATGQIYIYDIPTSTWKRGTPSMLTRAKMACATAGDYFIVWGGYTNGTEYVEILFYNFKKDSWITNSGGDPSDLPNVGVETSKGSKPVIIGGSVAAAVLVGIIVAFLVFRRCRHGSSDKDDFNQGNRHKKKVDKNSQKDRLNQDILTLPRASISRLNADATNMVDESPRVDDKLKVNLHDRNNNLASANREDQTSSYQLPTPNYPPPTAVETSAKELVTYATSAPPIQRSNRSKQELSRRPHNDPQYVAPVAASSIDYARIQRDLPQMEPPKRNPQGPSQFQDMEKIQNREPPTNPNKDVAQVHAWYEQALDRMRKEHQKELAKHQVQMAKQKAKMVKTKKVFENHPPNQVG